MSTYNSDKFPGNQDVNKRGEFCISNKDFKNKMQILSECAIHLAQEVTDMIQDEFC